MATIGTKDFGHYRGVATNQGFYKYYFNAVGTKVSGHYREGGHSSEVAIKRGSTVCKYRCCSNIISKLYYRVFVLSCTTTLSNKCTMLCKLLPSYFHLSIYTYIACIILIFALCDMQLLKC